MKVDGVEIVIESDASKACAQLDKMIAKLGDVNAQIRSTGRVNIGGKGGTSGATSGLKSYTATASKATKSTYSLASAFGKFYASCFLFIRGVKAIGKSIESSMDYIETYNYYNVIMDKIGTEFGSAWKENGYNSADEYAKSFKQRLNDLTGEMTGFKIGSEGGLYATDSIGLGLDPEKLMSFQAEVSSITNAVGLIGETSVNTSKALTMLSADLSSLKNQDLQSVMTNLRSGLIGQSRALYKYGIDITNNTLAEYALANGIKKKVSEMTQAEKMQLRMLAILGQSKVAYGDMANTINGVANQYRIFKQQVSNLARIIGNLFIPVLQAVLPYVNGFVIALQRLFTWLGNLMGVKWDGLMDGISSGYNDTGLDALGDSADDTTDALDAADKAAKKLKATIHGYDELHVATDPTSGSSSSGNTSGGGGFDLSGAIGDALGDYQSVWDEAMKGMENRATELADRIEAAFTKMWKAIEPFRKAVVNLWNNGLKKLKDFSAKSLIDFYDEFLKPLAKWAVGKGLPDLVNHLNAVLTKFDWNKLNAQLKSFWNNIEPFAEKVGTGLIEFLKDLIGFGASTLSAIGTVLEKLGGALGFVTKYSPATVEGLGYAIGVLVTAIWGFKKVVGITEGITGLAGSIAKMVIAHPYIAIAAGITAMVVALYGFDKAVQNQEEIGRYGDTVENLSNRMIAFSQSVKDHAKSAEEYVNGAGLAEIAMAEDLAEKYETLSQKTNLTAGEKKQLADYSAQLVELIPDLNGYLNEETGILDIQKDTLDGLIKKSKEYYTVKAAEEKLLESYKDKIDAEAGVKQAETALSTAKQSYENAKDYLDYWESLDFANRLFQDPLGTEYNNAKTAVFNLEMEINNLSSNLSTAEQALSDTDATIQALNGVIDGTTQTMDVASTKAYTYGTNVVKGYNKGIKDTKAESDKECSSWMDDFCAGATKALGIHSPSTVFRGYGENTVKGFNDGITSYQESSKSVMQTWAQKVSDWFTEKFQINSPSKLFEGFGEFTVEGFDNGIDNMLGSSSETIEKWSNMIQNSMKPTVSLNTDFLRPTMPSAGISSTQNIIQNVQFDIKSMITDALMDVVVANSNNSENNINLEAHIHVGDDTFGVASFKGIKTAQRQGLIPKMI